MRCCLLHGSKEMLRDLLASFDLPRLSEVYQKSARQVRRRLRSKRRGK